MREVFNGDLDQLSSPEIRVLFLSSGGNPITGLVFSDATLRYMRKSDTSMNTLALSGASFIEVSDGIYRVILDSALMAFVGSIFIYFDGAGFENFVYKYNVRSLNPGNVEIEILTQELSLAPIADVQVDIWDNGQTSLLWSGTTGGDGKVKTSLNPGSYKVLMRRSRTGFVTPETLTVIGPSAESVTYTGTVVSIIAPASPSVCLVYGYVSDISGIPENQVSPNYVAVHVQRVQNLNNVNGIFYTLDREAVKVSNLGYFEVELARGIKVNFKIPRVGVDKTFTVPNVATVDLSTLV